MADPAFGSAKVGDWSLYSSPDGSSRKCVVTGVENNDGKRIEITLRIEDRDADGEITESRTWSADADSWISGRLLRGDFDDDYLSVSWSEVEIKGEQKNAVVVTGEKEGRKTHRLVFAEGIGSAVDAELRIFLPTEIVVHKLVDYGDGSPTDQQHNIKD